MALSNDLLKKPSTAGAPSRPISQLSARTRASSRHIFNGGLWLQFRDPILRRDYEAVLLSGLRRVTALNAHRWPSRPSLLNRERRSRLTPVPYVFAIANQEDNCHEQPRPLLAQR